MKRISIEEHCWTEDSRKLTPPVKERPIYSPSQSSSLGLDITKILMDVDEIRLKSMDEAKIDIQVLLSSIKLEPFLSEGTLLARRNNDVLSQIIQRHPTRYSAFASLALFDPDEAARELERAVNDLGLKGALMYSNLGPGEYLDNQKYWAVFEKAAQLGVPIYLHPTSPSTDISKPLSEYPQMMGPIWGYAADTGMAAMRLICSGLFDRYPGLKIILGHLGEALPFWLWRIDNRWKKEGIAQNPMFRKLDHEPGYYVKNNFYVTTSGMLSEAALLCTSLTLGTDRILFAVDYPWESNLEAVEFMEKAPMSDLDREKIYHLNAEKLLGIK
jgi:predicted TIM-barrel fold metal-dependent hydrolase